MNHVILIGRIVRDPEVRVNPTTQVASAKFSIALDRGKDKDGNDRGADFPTVVCFGKTAELVERYLGKGRLVGVSGRIQTGSYEKDGKKVYTTDVLADRVEFLDKAEVKSEPDTGVVDGFSQLTDEDIPF